MNLIASVGYTLRGEIEASIVERGQVVRRFPRQRNLILNQGLDQIASLYIANCFQYAAMGSGTTPTESDSGVETVNIVSGTATISTIGFLAGDATDVGKTIKLDTSGNTFLVTGFTSTTQCTVSPSSTIGPDTFIIYNTNQTGLTTEITGGGGASRRTSTYLTGAPNCQTVTTGAVTVLTRTFDFSVETGPNSCNEVGFASTSTVGSNLFSRIKLPSTASLTAGQQLRVKYSVSVTVSPITPQTIGSSPVVGWPAATGTLQCEEIPVAFIQTNGFVVSTKAFNSVDSKYYCGFGEPSTTGDNFTTISMSSTAPAHGTYGAARSASAWLTQEGYRPTLSTYTVGTYTRDQLYTFLVGQANRSDWRALYLMDAGSASNDVVFLYVFDTIQQKLSTHTLTVGFRHTWGRVL
jgi:hypothetical protein